MHAYIYIYTHTHVCLCMCVCVCVYQSFCCTPETNMTTLKILIMNLTKHFLSKKQKLLTLN